LSIPLIIELRQKPPTRSSTASQLQRKRLGLHLTKIGREKKRADIVIVGKEHPDRPDIVVEVKKPKLLDGKAQLRSYCNATGAAIGVWTNGQQISYYNPREPNYYE